MPDIPRVELAPGYSIARVVNGCWQLTPDHGGGPGSRKETLERFSALVERGFTTFDCADIYVGTETLLGEFLATLDDPDRVQVQTKFVPDKDGLADLGERQIDAVVERSLERLGVERLDLLQFHWWDYDVPGLERMVERLLYLKKAGKIRLLGATNFNDRWLQRLLDVEPELVSMQTQYSLLDRRPERALLGSCLARGVGLLAYGALAGGFLSERYLGRPEPQRLNRSLTKYRLIIDEVGGWAGYQALLKTLADIAARLGSSVSQVAARWVLDQPGVAGIILGIGRESRLKDNVALASLKLGKQDAARLAAHLDHQALPPGDPFDLEREPEGRHAGIMKTNLQTGDGNP